MDEHYWHRQTNASLFPELEWSRPEQRAHAGKLLIIGGNSQGFAAVGQSYSMALHSGIGTARVVLPNVLGKVVGQALPEATFTPSNPSGGFAGQGLAELLNAATWSDGVLLPGDNGRNSETLALLERFTAKYPGLLTLTKDTADHFCTQPDGLLERPDTLLVLSMGQLQKLGVAAHFPQAFTSGMDMLKLVELLHVFTETSAPYVVTRHQGQQVVAVRGKISTTPCTADEPVWRIRTAATLTVWWLQHSAKPFEALTAGSYTPKA